MTQAVTSHILLFREESAVELFYISAVRAEKIVSEQGGDKPQVDLELKAVGVDSLAEVGALLYEHLDDPSFQFVPPLPHSLVMAHMVGVEGMDRCQAKEALLKCGKGSVLYGEGWVKQHYGNT